MKSHRISATITVIALALTMAREQPALAAGGTRLVPAIGTTRISETEVGADEIQAHELAANPIIRSYKPAKPQRGPNVSAQVGRRGLHTPDSNLSQPFPNTPLPIPAVRSSKVNTTSREATLTVEGLNFRDTRGANNGNQVSADPPGQALCVGNGFVVEAVNSVIRVLDSDAGSAVSPIQDLNTFFAYPAAMNYATGLAGPNLIDPVCVYDPDHKRFVIALTTLGVEPVSQGLTGKNTIDIAVSNTGDPTGPWTVYKVPAQNDGTDGTPNHHCTTDGSTPGPCFQDYPHIGQDAYGIYISTNEFDLFGPAYRNAQVFAFSKKELADHPANLHLTLVENLTVAGTPGYTVWPANSEMGQYEQRNNGTEYFLSTIAGDGLETGNPTGTNNKIALWALTNTSSLNTASPALRMRSTLIGSRTYIYPPKAAQKPGPAPLRECINDATTVTNNGVGCWRKFFGTEPAHNEQIAALDSQDARMQQTWFVNGRLYGAAGTALRVGGQVQAGIIWFQVSPEAEREHLSGEIEKQGYVGLAGNNLVYPAITMGTNERGVIGFSVIGTDYYPSTGYVTLDHDGRVGPVRIAAAGAGVSDTFSDYVVYAGSGLGSKRWGDYGAAVSDGRNIWIGGEYIAHSCTLTEYLAIPFGSCNATRRSLGNWATSLTRISLFGRD